MSVEVRVPTLFQRFTGGAKVVEAEGGTVGELMDNLDGSYPGIKAGMQSDDGEFHRFINIYLNGEDIRYLEQLNTAVAEGDVVTILPAIAGGRSLCG